MTHSSQDLQHWMSLWDETVLQEKQDIIRNALDESDLVLFFTKNNEVFGAPEESRLVFARMKNPDSDTPKGWGSEANFKALNLENALKGYKTETVIGINDLKKIKIIDKDDALKALCKEAKKFALDKSFKDIVGNNDTPV